MPLEIFLMVVTILAITTLLWHAYPTPTTSVVFINEIHYDNAGTDVGEGVEIAGTAGTDLTGWVLFLTTEGGYLIHLQELYQA
jgi:hypothetical protein